MSATDLKTAKADLKATNDAFIALAKKVNVPETPVATPKQGSLILLDQQSEASSEFVIESLLMKVQALAIQQPSQQKKISA